MWRSRDVNMTYATNTAVSGALLMKVSQRFRQLQRASLLLAMCALCVAFADAQAPTGSVTGLVKDATGAVVKDAEVVATNVDTNVHYKTVSAADGNYVLPSLPIGHYALAITAAGFKSEQRTGITIIVDQHAELDFSLANGEVSDLVTVNADAAQTETESHEIGAVVDEQKIEQLPLNSRNFNTLAYIVPGVYPPVFGSNLGYRGGFNVAGASEASNNFTLDGFDNNNEQLNVASFRPSVDAIAEFKVLTGLYPAEYGRNSGGQVAVTTKAGTNQFHGVIYEYIRNQLFDASNYFIPAAQKPAFKRNQFGGTLGGPIVKDKTFFFFAYEGLRLHQTLAALTTVPEAGWVSTGNLASYPKQLNNPYTGTPIPGNNLSLLPQWTGQAALVGRALASYYPAPTAPTAAGVLPTNNYNFLPLRTETSNQYTLRVDQTFTEHDSAFGEYNYYNDESFEPSNSTCASRLVPGFGCYSGLPLALIGLSETHIFTPHLLNIVKLGFNKYEQSRIQQDVNIPFNTTHGITNVFNSVVPDNIGVPSVTVTSFAAVGGPPNLPQDLVNDAYQIGDQVIWSKGAHTFTIGVDIRRVQQNTFSVTSGRGVFAFSASTATPTTGYALADLLLGLPTTTSNNPYAPKIYVRTSGFNGYFQDDWKATPRLTLNLGMRWELATPFTSTNNQISSFNPTTGTLAVAGQNGVGRNLIQYDYSKFLPRVGFSYSVAKNTVLRGGYGINAGTPPTFTGIGNLYYNPPMRAPQTFTSSTASQITLANPFPTGSAALASTLAAIDYHFITPYIQQYGVGIQQQLTPNTLLDVSYLGSKGTHLVDAQDINQPIAQAAVTTVAGVNALRPFPTYGNITQYQTRAASSYNSLQVKLDKRLSRGLSVLISYTLGKSLDNSSGYNAVSQQNGNLTRDYGHSDFDSLNRLAVSPIYQLPFGAGKQFLTHGIGSVLAGGWQLSGIYQIQSGHYLTPLYSANVSNTYNLRDRPNVTGNPNTGPHTTKAWFNTGVYSKPLDAFGNAPRNSILSPAYQDFDATLARNFALPRKGNLQFRAEFFNIVNHPNFDPPSVTADSTAFGTISTAEDPREMQFALRITY
jgi:hypothetical protein